MQKDTDLKKVKTLIIIVGLVFLSVITYLWTIKLPIIGDGLMHLNDNTDISSFKNIIKSFYTFHGIGKPENSATLGFHRPIFNEIIVELVKEITNCNIYKIRIISVVIHSLSVIIAYFIGWEIFKSYLKASCLALFINFALTYFQGVYEFGLSFSLWLTVFVMLSFYFTVRYEKERKIQDFFFALFFSFLSIFTKESALTLGIALSWYILGKDIYKNRKITKITIYFGVSQAIILSIYLFSRYIKLGSLFSIVGGIDAGNSITFRVILSKVIGYFYYALNIPNKCFPSHICTYINDKLVILSIFMICVPIYILYRVISMIKAKDKKLIDCFLYFGMYLILIIPVFKVTRNAPYYGDIFVLFLLLIVLTIHNGKSKLDGIYLAIFLSAYILIFSVNIYDSVKRDSNYYLSVTSNKVMDLKKKLNENKNDIQTNRVLLSNNWLRNSDELFIYHHNGMGSFYKFNIDIRKETDIIRESNFDGDATIIDYFEETGSNNLEIFIFPGKERNTKLVQIEYESDKNDNIAVGFFYNDQYYYSSIDVNNKKGWSEDNKLYFVIPKEANIDVVGTDCTIKYFED